MIRRNIKNVSVSWKYYTKISNDSQLKLHFFSQERADIISSRTEDIKINIIKYKNVTSKPENVLKKVEF